MLSLSTAFVVLHTGQSVTLGEYLFRVLLHLAAFACTGGTLFWAARALESRHSEASRREGTDDDEP